MARQHNVVSTSIFLIILLALGAAVHAADPKGFSATVGAPKMQEAINHALKVHRQVFAKAADSRVFAARTDEHENRTLCDRTDTIASTLQDRCQFGTSFELAFAALIDFNNISTGARAAVEKMCSTTCLDAIKEQLRTYKPCFWRKPEVQLALSVIQSLCQREDGQICAIRIKATNRIVCDGSSASSCTADNKMCRWRDGSCELFPNDSGLQEVCTNCFKNYILMLANFDRVHAPIFLHLRDLLCSKSDSGSFCYPIVQAADNRTLFLDPSNSMTIAEATDATNSACSANNRQCFTRFSYAISAILRAAAIEAFLHCLDTSSLLLVCIFGFATVMQAIQSIVIADRLRCTKNDAGQFCVPYAHEFVHNPCTTSIRATHLCNQTCVDFGQDIVQRGGCCFQTFSTILQADWDRNFFPWTTYQYYAFHSNHYYGDRATANLSLAVNVSFEGNPAYPYWRWCPALNTDSFGNAINHSCSGMTNTPPVKVLPLRLIKWLALAGNLALRKRIEQSLCDDIARSMGIDRQWIVDGTLEQDTSVVLDDGSAGCKFTFKMSGSSNSDGSSNSASFDSMKSANTLVVSDAAQVILDECLACIGQPTTVAGQTAAPMSTTNLFASMVGQDPSGTVAPDADSSAPSATTFAVAALSGIVTLLMMYL